jgi:hypothetical protein
MRVHKKTAIIFFTNYFGFELKKINDKERGIL